MTNPLTAANMPRPQPHDIKGVVTDHQKAIYRLAYRLTGNVEDAKDLTQEVFLRAYKGLKTFRGDSEVKTWLYRIAINLGSSWRKKESKNYSVSLEEIPEPQSSENEQSELAKAVKNAVEALPYKQRTVFVMHHYEGLKHEEIAGITGRSEGSVKANYHQAVQKLKEALKEYQP
jgi:RNA polymerase sigma-70 factor (ECF subfamily)